ncbi:hypothetical protein TWF730_007149 [Orbilia blumenaviensis]|uniref:Uncharacterized protein n=1 Tax=Orbilia blumenaviensis TaxID=1796055 RepID=A0AAV9VIX2_9PEZI
MFWCRIFVVVPAIAQSSVDGATVQVDAIAITNPKPNDITVSMNSTVKAKVPVGGAQLSSQTFEMYLPSAGDSKDMNLVPKFATLEVGQAPVKDVFSINVTGSETPILNQDIFQEFSSQVLKNNVINLGLRANPAPNIGIGPLKFPVKFQKVLQLRGFNMLKGITLTNATVLTTPLEDGTNMVGDGVIPNPSSFVMQVGELTTNITVAGLALGFSVIKDLVLYPGDNKVKIFTHLSDEWSGSPLVSSVVSQSNVNITLTITSVIFNGAHVPWLEKPMSDLSPFYALMNPEPIALEEVSSSVEPTSSTISSTEIPVTRTPAVSSTSASLGTSAMQQTQVLSTSPPTTRTVRPSRSTTVTSSPSAVLPTKFPEPPAFIAQPLPEAVLAILPLPVISTLPIVI